MMHAVGALLILLYFFKHKSPLFPSSYLLVADVTVTPTGDL